MRPQIQIDANSEIADSDDMHLLALCPGLAWQRPPTTRRSFVAGGAGVMMGDWRDKLMNPFGAAPAEAAVPRSPGSKGPTNEVVRTVNGIRHKRLGAGDIIVSEVGLGTQRWGSSDFNGPDEELCHKFMDRAVLDGGVNLIDTAEQYPIPSDRQRPEGDTERIIGRWMAKDKGRRQKVVLASKITGGQNVNAKNIKRDLEGTLQRLGTDYLDVYLLHWPARYSPQANWGQSLEYKLDFDIYSSPRASFEEIAGAMGDMIREGKLRGWGMCNDNCYGLTASAYSARALGVPPPVAMQNDYSIINRRIEENGLSEAASPLHENTGFMAYNVLAGGVLTGKYLDVPAATDDADRTRGMANRVKPRGRMDEVGWGQTLYRYRSGPADAATREYAALAKKYKMSLTELAIRWAQQRSAVTSTLLGHTSMAQLDETLAFYAKKEPLPEQLLWEVDRVHMKNRNPIWSSTRVGKDWDGQGEIGEPIP